ncbi:hypothetical protein PAHAL_9G381700 [Panicum hallii]|uniref:Uncharacterized protein n=1 Tax=Panicum hallii TaxID=206008 RepID=A0A2T8I3X5_9POAL|nr:hypothetical protein PAHAL_9G381700 [Panicum hallii]
MLGVNHHHQVRRAVRRSRSPLITDSANSSSRTTDDEADADEAPTSSVEPPSYTAKRLSCRLVLCLVLAPFLLWRRTDQPVALAGMTVLYLNTICAAGLCGVAIAERRRRSGSEKSAKAVRINDKSDPAFPAMVASLMSLVCAARVLWMCFSFGPEDAVSAIFELSFMAIVSLFSWTLFVDGCLLHGALFSGHTLGMLGVAGLMFFYTMLFALAMLFAMATAGLLGYTLTVDQQYKQLQRASH